MFRIEDAYTVVALSWLLLIYRKAETGPKISRESKRMISISPKDHPLQQLTLFRTSTTATVL
jgi:DNA-binding HxlR family transcriptional regulator